MPNKNGLRAAVIVSVLLFVGEALRAQECTLGTSTMSDENIFDVYAPYPDRITQVQLDASDYWDADQLTLSVAYTGALLLFRDLTARNYHVHALSLTSHYQFDPPEEYVDDEDEDTPPPLKPPVPLDSLTRSLTATLNGISQFDKEQFKLYDVWRIGASVIYRWPLGTHISARPTIGITFSRYPNIVGLSNIHNSLGVLLGFQPAEGTWIALTPLYSVKSYPATLTATYTVSVPGPSGHGKGGGNGGQEKTKTIELSTPAVQQLSVSLLVKQKAGPGTELSAQVGAYSTPTTEARILPQQLRGSLEDIGIPAENEIFDDRFSYSGPELRIGLQQALPYAVTLTATGFYQHKTYTIPAMDLQDSLVLAPHREDHRTETEVNLSRPFALGAGKRLLAKLEVHFFWNSSNAPYYEFDKRTVMAGLEFSF